MMLPETRYHLLTANDATQNYFELMTETETQIFYLKLIRNYAEIPETMLKFRNYTKILKLSLY